jgi:hypothetical protein
MSFDLNSRKNFFFRTLKQHVFYSVSVYGKHFFPGNIICKGFFQATVFVWILPRQHYLYEFFPGNIISMSSFQPTLFVWVLSRQHYLYGFFPGNIICMGSLFAWEGSTLHHIKNDKISKKLWQKVNSGPSFVLGFCPMHITISQMV